MAPRSGRGASPHISVAQFNRLVKTVTRVLRLVEENTRVSKALEDEYADLRDEQRVNMRRMAQLQAELDAVKKAWTRMQGP